MWTMATVLKKRKIVLDALLLNVTASPRGLTSVNVERTSFRCDRWWEQVGVGKGCYKVGVRKGWYKVGVGKECCKEGMVGSSWKRQKVDWVEDCFFRACSHFFSRWIFPSLLCCQEVNCDVIAGHKGRSLPGKYAGTLDRSSLFDGQYFAEWLHFHSNRPTHPPSFTFRSFIGKKGLVSGKLFFFSPSGFSVFLNCHQAAEQRVGPQSVHRSEKWSRFCWLASRLLPLVSA